MKRIFFSILAGILCLFVIWCFGVDLTKRGNDLGAAVFLTTYVVLAVNWILWVDGHE